MIFNKTDIEGAWLIEPERFEDERGFFTRAFCPAEFEKQGIEFHPVQSNISNNKKALTLRGMHYHASPFEETKLVRCTSGKIFDVVVDLRPHSGTYKQWAGFELSRGNGNALFIPPGCAHGFLTLEEETDIFYQMGPAFVPGYDRGFRWDDPVFEIAWPDEPKIVSKKDRQLPFWAD
ncbi:MAG: dTDP-4-dehydrorhamnose 3,5-epimerase [Sneathiellales bacterium]|nr:dTDP-4-dehydrorhamnose 3,5-epimerase [Sneathiellales bacterium]